MQTHFMIVVLKWKDHYLNDGRGYANAIAKDSLM
jgi:hypothetical protein